MDPGQGILGLEARRSQHLADVDVKKSSVLNMTRIFSGVLAHLASSPFGAILAIAILVGLASGSHAQTITAGDPTEAASDQGVSSEQCLDPQVCPITYVRLSRQDREPFLFLGKVLDEDHPRYGDYRKALHRFPNVRSCLTEDEHDSPQPDLRQMDWDTVRNIRDIDVCVFRIASSIEDVEMIRLWLQGHGFNVGKLIWRITPNYSPRFETEPVSGFHSHLTVDRFRKIIPRTIIEKLLGIEMMRSYWLSISFSESGQIVGVRSGGNSILN